MIEPLLMAHLINSASAEMGASLMCADQGNLRGAVIELDRAGIDYFHFDVMDGRFVPNFAMSADAMKALRQASGRPFDAHLMIERPERHVGRFIDCGADSITVHVEAAGDLPGLAKFIRKAGRKAGAAISPATPVSSLAPVIRDIDFVCVMSVEPGFAGQKFIESTLPRLDQLAAMIRSTGSPARIQVDGNVSLQRIPELLARGVSRLVGGTSAIFRPGTTLGGEVAVVRRLIHSLEGAAPK